MKRLAVASLAFALLAGCASSDISDRATEALQARVQSIRDAVEDEDRDLVEHRLDLLEQQVLRFRRAGELSDSRSMRIMAAARGVASNISELPEPYVPPVIVTVTPTPTDDDDDEEDRGGPGRGKGRGKGGDED